MHNENRNADNKLISNMSSYDIDKLKNLQWLKKMKNNNSQENCIA